MTLSKTYLVGVVASVSFASQAYAQNLAFTSQFPLNRCHFSVFGGDPYYILNPGHQVVLKGKDDGEDVVLVITALDQIKEITLLTGGQSRKITTRVIETRETLDGKLEEVARGFHARCLETGDVYYFGEEKDEYKDGKIADQEVVWEAGVKGATPGLIMPGSFLFGRSVHASKRARRGYGSRREHWHGVDSGYSGGKARKLRASKGI